MAIPILAIRVDKYFFYWNTTSDRASIALLSLILSRQGRYKWQKSWMQVIIPRIAVNLSWVFLGNITSSTSGRNKIFFTENTFFSLGLTIKSKGGHNFHLLLWKHGSNNALLIRTSDINVGCICISSLGVYKPYRYLRYIIKPIPSNYWRQCWSKKFGAFIITSARNACGWLGSFAEWKIHARLIFLWLFGASHCLSWWLHIMNKITILNGKM